VSRRPSQTEDDGSSFGKKKTIEMELDITPMIDVTFLLLIFFMVASTMQPKPRAEVPTAINGTPQATQNASELFITGSTGQKPVIETIQGTTQVEIKLEEVKATIEEAAAAGKKHVIVHADRKVPSGFVGEVLAKIQEVEGVTSSIGVRKISR